MILQILPCQVKQFWGMIAYAVYKAMPPETPLDAPDSMNFLLEGLLRGDIQAWAGMDDEKKTIVGICVTTFTYDLVSKAKNLLIFAVHSYANTPISRNMWGDGYQVLKQYARANDCYALVLYTKEQRLVEISERFPGCNTSFVCSLPVW